MLFPNNRELFGAALVFLLLGVGLGLLGQQGCAWVERNVDVTVDVSWRRSAVEESGTGPASTPAGKQILAPL